MLIAAASDVHLRNAGDRDGDPLTRVDIDRSHLQGHCVQGQPVSVCHTDALADFQDASAYDADAFMLLLMMMLLLVMLLC